MIVSVIGMGYIGLPTAAILASMSLSAIQFRGSSEKIEVVGVDVNQHTVKTINEGKIQHVEPDLEILVQTAIKTGNLRASIQACKADVFLIAVPTPFKNNREPDLSFIKAAVKSISSVLEKGNLVVLESTSPVGTTEKMIGWMREDRQDLSFPIFGDDNTVSDVAVAHCPERVMLGQVVSELVENDRIIGGVTSLCAKQAREFYKIFVKGECFITDSRTAELSKLVENSFRDVNIAFANEISLICDTLSVNVWELINLSNRHPRVNILQPGPGVGGHCIAVDPWFIVDSVPEDARLIHTARKVNDEKPKFVLKKIEQAVTVIGREYSEISIASLGLTYKPNINDLRESPALEIVQGIELMGFSKQFLVEPNIEHLPNCLDTKKNELIELEKAIVKADIVVLLVDHKQFKEMDIGLLTGKQLVDTRGVWINQLM